MNTIQFVVPFPALNAEAEAIETAPVTMPSSDPYGGLQRGVVGCGSNPRPPSNLSAFWIWEQASYEEGESDHGLTFVDSDSLFPDEEAGADGLKQRFADSAALCMADLSRQTSELFAADRQ